MLVHLIQRERKRVIEFPSLMFIRRIPYQSVRRRRIRHWLLLCLRAAAVALIVLAFARPFLQRDAGASAVTGGAREVVILLDQSASMGYGDHWQKARDAARGVVRGMGADDRATLVLFSRNAEENMRATSDRTRLEGAIDTAKVSSGATRYGPALKLAESILSRSPMKRREAVLISDFQKSGWSGSEDAHFPDGMTLIPTSVASPATANLSVPSVSFARAAFSGQERITVTAGLSNKGDEPLKDVPVILSVDGHDLETTRAAVGPHASTSVSFAPFTLATANVRGSIRAGSDPLPADNNFFFVLAPSEPVSLAIVDGFDKSDASLFLARALSIGSTPAFQIDTTSTSRVAPATFDKRSVVVLNDTPFPPGGAGALKRFVERGGGLLIVAGDHATWPSSEADLFPGRLGPVVDRTSGRSASLGFLDYSHPVFEVFKAPHSGDFSAAHVFRYRTIETGPNDRVLARYDDGAIAAAERKVGLGRVIVWTTTLDDTSTDMPSSRYSCRSSTSWCAIWVTTRRRPHGLRSGRSWISSARIRSRAARIVVSPSGDRTTQSGGGEGAEGLLELNEQGVYEVRSTGASTGRPEAIAVNLDPAESDLSPLDSRELVAAVTGRAATAEAQQMAPQEVTREDAEKRQSLWWYLLFAGLLLLAAETIISNRLSQKEKFL